MLKKSVVENTISAALSTGGNFAEIFMEDTKRNSISMVNGKVEKAFSGIDYGVGIRIFNGTNAIYAFTNDTSEKSLIETAKSAAAVIKNGNGDGKVMDFTKKIFDNRHQIKIMPETIDKKEKLKYLELHQMQHFVIVM